MLDFDYLADGCLDPSTYVSALSKACQMLGGQIVTNTSVTGMSRRGRNQSASCFTKCSECNPR